MRPRRITPPPADAHTWKARLLWKIKRRGKNPLIQTLLHLLLHCCRFGIYMSDKYQDLDWLVVTNLGHVLANNKKSIEVSHLCFGYPNVHVSAATCFEEGLGSTKMTFSLPELDHYKSISPFFILNLYVFTFCRGWCDEVQWKYKRSTRSSWSGETVTL